ncbi:ATP-binding cassette domain-containing protein [Beduini massiliensis]|uniref:ATP-binding cassette domain-containing protein n=1 Tax=Beduini massiliensis TaxID=1585974 RepID=UPI00059AABC7|nr:ABC transporter ATP-binding protein [Beduini massiliensis]
MLKIFINIIKKKKTIVFLYLILLILLNVCIIVYPLYLNKVLSHIQELSLTEIGEFIALSLAIPILSLLKDRALNYTDNVLSIYMSNDLIQRILKKDVLQIKNFSPNYITRAVNNFSGLVCNFYLYNIVDSFISIIAVIVMFVILGKENIYLALFIVIINLLRLIIVINYNSKLERANKEKIKMENIYYDCFNSYILKLKSIILRNKKDSANQQLSLHAEEYLSHAKRYSFPISVISTINNAGIWIIHFLTVLFSLILSKMTVITFYTIQLAFSYSQQMGNSFQNIVTIFPSYANIKAFYKVVEEFLKLEDLKSDGDIKPFKTVELKNVSFRYRKDVPIIQCMNYKFHSGNLYIISGENGKGKSTLLKLLTGIYSNYQGQILLDDTPINNYNICYYQRYLVSFLTQEDLLFEGTVASNMLEKNREKLAAMCNYLKINDPNKIVNVDGNNLSGGEKRKILLARVLLDIQNKDPSLIIFDEPTYALEKDLAEKVLTMIKTLSASKIVIMISHDEINHTQLLGKCEIVNIK